MPVPRDEVLWREWKLATEDVAEAAVAATAAVEHLVGDVPHHDRREDRQQLAEQVAAARAAGLAAELVHDGVAVAAEDVADDRLAVGGVDRGRVGRGALVLTERVPQRALAAGVLRVGLHALDERGDRLLRRGAHALLVGTDLLRQLTDGQLVHDVVDSSHDCSFDG